MANSKMRIFNDPIHGHFELSPLSVKIIDTPQFQRLRDISQLGTVYYVFPGASSKRFEHCIGVAHLSRTFIHEIHQRQPELQITPEDMLCLEIAGLCHDLGHGPYSHLFDSKILPQIVKDPSIYHFEHEHASIGIFDLLIEENKLLPEFAKYGLHEEDIHFIKELILGSPDDMPKHDGGMKWCGRGEKTFLYDIVANKRNGIDVDKFDYFARDCHVLGLTKSFDSLRLMRFARVHKVQRKMSTLTSATSIHNDLISIDESTDRTTLSRTQNTSKSIEEEGHYEICYHIKEAWNIFELFHTRYTLHKRAYQHRVAGAINHMITEVLVLANPFFTVPGLHGIPRKMSECPEDYEAYWKLGEYIIRVIENSTDENLKPARAMMKRLRQRDLLPSVAEILLPPESLRQRRLNDKKIHQEIYDIISTTSYYPSSSSTFQSNSTQKTNLSVIIENDKPIHQTVLFSSLSNISETISSEVPIEYIDIFVSVVSIGYGKGGMNPVSELTTFYQPLKEDGISSVRVDSISNSSRTASQSTTPLYTVGLVPPESISLLTPREFEESYVRIYCRYKNQIPIVRSAFQKWCNEINAPYQSTTPLKRPRISS